MVEASTPPPPPGTRARRSKLGFAGVGWIGRSRLEALAANALDRLYGRET